MQTTHLLHTLYLHQQQHRYISDQAIIDIAKQHDVPRAQVESVTEFYSFFYRQPIGLYHILFSNCTSCGDQALMQQLCDKLKLSLGETRSDQLVSIEEASCIGLCDHGASCLINDRPIHSLSSDKIDKICQLIESKQSMDLWPTEWFDVNNQLKKQNILYSQAFQAGEALKQAISHSSEENLAKIASAKLRGRGGAGFGTADKWRFCREAKDETRYVICNADEGEPGTFKDRALLAENAEGVFEGMTIAAQIIGASEGFLYLRGEYRYLLDRLEQTLASLRKAKLLGKNILDKEGFDFDISIVVGAGAYICGEESALIESLEQKCGIPRIRPPFPVTKGYLGKPTIVNNVETLFAVAKIISQPQDWFSDVGTAQSKGSKILSISGDCERPGLYEYPFGVSVQQILQDCGAKNTQAVQIGGPSGTLIAADQFEHLIAFEDLASGGSFMIFDQSQDMLAVIKKFSEFFAHESCGFCTPCRVGTSLLKNKMSKVTSGRSTSYDLDELKKLVLLVSKRSHCGLGMTASNPIRDGIKFFPHIFAEKMSNKMEPEFDLDESLAEARAITKRDDKEAHL